MSNKNILDNGDFLDSKFSDHKILKYHIRVNDLAFNS